MLNNRAEERVSTRRLNRGAHRVAHCFPSCCNGIGSVTSAPETADSIEAWQIIVLSVIAWFIPESGRWQNGVLNLMIVILLAVPLAATYRVFHA